jgi:hypothetical protein
MKKLVAIIVLSLFLFSCKKTQFEDIKKVELNSVDAQSFSSRINSGTSECEDCTELANSYADTIDHPTILGANISNPYTISNMNQAYFNVYGNYPSAALPVTHLYVKFSPSNLSQLASLEDEDIDLTSFPLDKELIFEGDYYIQPGKGIEDLPDLWAVVPVGYQFPAGIPHTILTEMFIPDNTPILEDEALYISGNLGNDSISYKNNRVNRGGIDDVTTDPQCPCSDLSQPCPVWPNCGNGGGYGGGSTNCNHTPKGRITVQNKLATDFSYRGVRQLRVVIRRTFKVDRIFTDDNGNFATTKYFKNKYTILVKFKNEFARIGRMRPFAIWEQFFPIKINLGRWNNLPCNYEFKIDNPTATSTIQTSHWAAATTHNAVIEHREMCQQEGVGVPLKHLHILLASERNANNGNTYMTNKILASGGIIPYALITHWAASALGIIPVAGPVLAPIVVSVAALWAVRAPDIVFGYGGNYTSFLATDQYCELVYHELTHSGHYTQVGNLWWINLGLDEKYNTGEGSYGACCQTRSQKIAVAESWAYHMGQYLANKKWGLECTTFPEQGSDISNFVNTINFSAGGGKSSKENFLEDFEPGRDVTLDPNRWLAKGLFYDMIDNGLESPASNIVDNVSSFTNQQFYQALQSNVNSMIDYKAKFLQQNNNSQQIEINALFTEYGF